MRIDKIKVFHSLLISGVSSIVSMSLSILLVGLLTETSLTSAFARLTTVLFANVDVTFRILLFIAVFTLIYGSLVYSLLNSVAKLWLVNLLLLSLVPAIGFWLAYNWKMFLYIAWFCLWHASVSWLYYSIKRNLEET